MADTDNTNVVKIEPLLSVYFYFFKWVNFSIFSYTEISLCIDCLGLRCRSAVL